MSFKKLNWIQKGEIQITSGFHGSFQNNQAQDFRANPLFAPEKCKIKSKVSAGYNSLVELEILDTVGTVFYQIVHFEIEKPQGYIYQKGEEIKGKDTSGNNHFHIALNINNVWYKVLEFTKQDRNIKIVYLRNTANWSTFDFEKWSYYDEKGDKAIQFKDSTPTPPEPPEPKPLRTYKVKSGDTLSEIAKKKLGNSSRYLEIYNLNKDIIGSNPNKILPGQILKLPN